MITSTQKLLAAVGLAGAMLLGATTDASAHPFRGPYFRPAPVYRAPVYRGPVYGPAYPAPGYGYGYGPVYRGVDWRRHEWVRMHGWHRW
jgi:hypothetical protein